MNFENLEDTAREYFQTVSIFRKYTAISINGIRAALETSVGFPENHAQIVTHFHEDISLPLIGDIKPVDTSQFAGTIYGGFLRLTIQSGESSISFTPKIEVSFPDGPHGKYVISSREEVLTEILVSTFPEDRLGRYRDAARKLVKQLVDILKSTPVPNADEPLNQGFSVP